MRVKVGFKDGKEFMFSYSVHEQYEKAIMTFLMTEGTQISNRWKSYYLREQGHITDTMINFTIIPSDNLKMPPYVLELIGHEEKWESHFEKILIEHGPFIQKKIIQILDICKEFSPKLILWLIFETAQSREIIGSIDTNRMPTIDENDGAQ